MKLKSTIDHLDIPQRTDRLIQVNDQVSLRVACFAPVTEKKNMPIVIVGGLATVILSFKDLIVELIKDHQVYYTETRENPSSKVNGKVSYDIENAGKDIASLIQKLDLENENYALIGYSLSASVISDGYRFMASKPKCMVFIEPTPVFHYPKWSIPIIRMFGASLYKLLKPIANWYIGNFIIDKKQDPEMALISSRALNQADPKKLKNAILAISNYTVWNKLQFIDCPTLIVGASKDKFHNQEETKRIISLINHSSYTDLETNKRTHNAEMGIVIRNYINSLNNDPMGLNHY
jgi:pimeloyl-ACP methyl ester carboxylesterase